MSNPKLANGVTVELGMPVWTVRGYPLGIKCNIIYGIFRYKVQWQHEDCDGYIGAKLTSCYSNRTLALKGLSELERRLNEL